LRAEVAERVAVEGPQYSPSIGGLMTAF